MWTLLAAASAVTLAPPLTAQPIRGQRVAASPPGVTSDLSRAALAQIEDGRGVHADLAPLIGALRSANAGLRLAAVRGLGRFQAPAFLPHVLPLLYDADPGVRREAVNAAAQLAVGMRGAPDARARVASLSDALQQLARTAAGRSPEIRGVIARALGRFPYTTADEYGAAEQRVVALLPGGRIGAGTPAPFAEGVAHALYTMARTRRSLGPHGEVALRALNDAVGYRGRGARDEAAARVRRLGMLGLSAAAPVALDVVRRAAADGDEQVRRLAMGARVRAEDDSAKRALVTRHLRDPSAMVRHEAVRAWRPWATQFGCAHVAAATSDADPAVALAAIDVLGGGCRDSAQAAEVLKALAAAPSASQGQGLWHLPARAMVSLARVDPAVAQGLVRSQMRSPVSWTREYVARAATLLRDSITLSVLARDADGNVRETAIRGLAASVGHLADRVFAEALSSNDYQVVLTAATVLQGAPLRDSLVPVLFRELDRLTRERRETSRDPREALLDRIDELASSRDSARLAPYVADFDSTIARRAAVTLMRWTGRQVAAQPTPLEPPEEPLEEVLAGRWRARVVMAANGRRLAAAPFEIQLHADEAPATVARFVRLARAGWYNGRTFHRVEPGFVIQGGSPGANEYIGDGPFMRDEVGLRSHTRGTLGISTRGRDTGDAQIFVNLTDNFRLDHDYTVFATVVTGRDVAESVLAGDVIERVEIVRVR